MEPANLIARHILLIERDYFIATVLAEECFKQSAIVLGPVPTGAEALSILFGTQRLDGAVLDSALRDGTSLAVADALVDRSIPFLLSSDDLRGEVERKYPRLLRVDRATDPVGLLKVLTFIINNNNFV